MIHDFKHPTRSSCEAQGRWRRSVALCAASLGLLFGLASLGATNIARAQEAGSGVPPTETWQQDFSSEGIEISSRAKIGTSYREVRGSAIYGVSPEAFLPLFRDAEGYKSWLAECKESSAVGTKRGLNDFHLYAVIGIPWPFEDRDTVVKAKLRKLPGGKGYVVFLKSMNDELSPARKGLVRMKSLEGRWLLEALPGGKTKAEFRIFLEPAGNLSPVFVNQTASSIQTKTLRNVRERLGKADRGTVAGDVPELGLTDPPLEP